MSTALFKTQKTASRESSRNTAIAVAAVLFSLVLHLGTYGAVRNRIVSFLQTIADAIASPQQVEEEVTRVELYEPTKNPLSEDLLRTADPRTATSKLPSDLLAQSRPDEVFSAPPVKDPPATPTVLPPAPIQADEPRIPPPSELFAVDILAVTDARDDAMALPVMHREIITQERKLLAPDPSTVYAAPQTPPPVDLQSALSRVPKAVSAPESSQSVRLPLPKSIVSLHADEVSAPAIGPSQEGRTASELMVEPWKDIAPATPLDDRLHIRTYALRPESDPDHFYFQVDITPRDPDALPDIPRDIVFVQDTSNSLSFKRLPPCLRAISSALRTLKPSDRFNLCVFADETAFLRPGDWLSPTPEAIAEADAFLKPLQSSGNTDLFQSMHEVLALPRDPDRAQIAILLTDGRITAGALSRDSAVIGTFSRLNAGVFSVFTVNVNAKGNAYLLDMLSFCDRGGNTATAKSSFEIARTIEGVVASIGQPILTDVRFQFDSNASAEAFPGLTSNLYRDRPIRLYGRVPADSPVFAFQARGNANGDKYDMLFEVNLEDSSTAEAPDSIVADWANQRMYGLVSDYAKSEDPAILREMQRHGLAFGIPIPHAGRLGVPQAQPKQ